MAKSVEFSEEIVRAAFERCGGQCECDLNGCGHVAGYCPQLFTYEDRATSDREGWQAHHIVPVSENGPAILQNCQILCMSCHVTTHLS